MSSKKTDGAFNLAHQFADTDLTDKSLHHTIGKGTFQAARGSDVAKIGKVETVDLEYTPITANKETATMSRSGELVTVEFQLQLDAGGVGNWRITPPVGALIPEDIPQVVGEFFYSDSGGLTGLDHGILVLSSDGYIYALNDVGYYSGAAAANDWFSGQFQYVVSNSG